MHNILILPTFLYVSEKWTLTALQRRRIEAAKMKLLRPLAGYTLYDQKTNDSTRLELQITCTLDKIFEYRLDSFSHLQECHKTESPRNHTITDHKEGEQFLSCKTNARV
jgi:hypothetical protein